MNKGLLLPVNNNDTDEDGTPDFYDTIVNGQSDQGDLRDLHLLVRALPSDSKVRLWVESGEGQFRFRLYDDQWNQILGAPALDEDGQPAGSALTEIEYPVTALGTGWKVFHLEGVDRGIVRIRATHKSAAGQVYATDIVKIIVFRISSFASDGDEVAGGEQIEVSADNPALPYVTMIDFVDEAGEEVHAEDGSPVSWEVVSGSATLSTNSGTTINGFTSTFVTAPTTAGSTFRLRSEVTSVKIGGATLSIGAFEHKTPELMVVPGRPAVVTLTPDAEETSYPASEANKLAFTVTSEDAHGNVTPDGTEVSVILAGDGGIDPEVTQAQITSGSARVGTIAGFAPESQELAVMVGEQEVVATLDEVPINIALTPSAGSVEAGSDQFVDISATVQGADGSAVADGTEIVWLSSLGSFAADGGARGGPVAVGTVTGGQASARLYTACTNASGQVISGTDVPGTARIIVAIGLSQTRMSVEFTPPVGGQAMAGPPVGGDDLSPPIRLQFERRALAGDATEDGTVAIDAIDFLSQYELMIAIRNALDSEATVCPECDLDADGFITLVDLIRARNQTPPTPPTAPYWAQTQVTVFGGPDEMVQITVSDPSLVTPTGLDENNQITLNSSGQATFTLRSTGALTADLGSVTITATRVTGGGFVGPAIQAEEEDEDDVKLVLMPKETHGWAYNALAGAVWGGGEGATAFAADAVVSYGLLGDIRDMAIQTGKLWPGGDDPDGLTVAFASAGILGTFTGPGDAAVTLMKRVSKQLHRLAPNSSAAKVIFKVLKDLVSRVRSWSSFISVFNEWKVFFTALVKNDDYVRLIANYGKEAVDRSRRVLVRFGETWAGHFVKAGAEVGVFGARKTIQILDALDDATIALLKGWPAARQERLVKGLAECRGRKLVGEGRWVGKIDDDVLKALLDKDKIAAIQQHWTDFDIVMEQLGKVARNGTENAGEFTSKLDDILIDYLDNAEGNLARLKGHLNELKQLSDRLDVAGVAVKGTGKYATTKGVIQLDGWGELSGGQRIIWEFKHGFSPTGRQKEKLIKEITARVELAKQQGHYLSGARIEVHLEGNPWSPTLKQTLMNLGNNGIIVEVVP